MSHLQDALRIWAAKTVEQLATGRATPGTPSPLADPSVMDVLDAAPPELRLLLVAELAGGPHGLTGAAIKTEEEEGKRWLTLLRDDAGEQAEPYAPSAALALAMTRARKGPVTTYDEAREYLLQLAKLLRTAIAHEAHVRLPTTLTTAIIDVRGGALEREAEYRRSVPGESSIHEWTVYAQNKCQLVLPFAEAMTQGGVSGTSIRIYFDGITLRSYVATFAMRDREGHPDGYFRWDPAWFILEVCKGTPTYTTAKTGKRYPRANPKSETALNKGLDSLLGMLLSGITTRNLEINIRTPEPLVQEVTSPGRSGAIYYHSQLVRESARENFMQVPHAVCALHADRLPMGIGLARWWKARFDIDITRGTGVSRTTLRELLEVIGERPAERARRDGRSYWAKAALQVVGVMRDGELGEATITGEGPTAVVTLVPSKNLADAYTRRPVARDRDREAFLLAAARHTLEDGKRGRGRPRKPRLPPG